MNEPIGRLGSCRPGAAAADGVGHGLDRLVLVDQPLVDPLFEHQQLGPLGLHHPRHGDAGPGADDLGDLLGPDLLAQQAAPGVGCSAGPSSGLASSCCCELLPLHVAARRAAGSRASRTGMPDGLLLLDLRAELVEAAARLRRAACGSPGRCPGRSFPSPTAGAGRRASRAARRSPPRSRPAARWACSSVSSASCRCGQLQLHQPPLHLRRSRAGTLSSSMASRLVASSIRSMALSGRKRSAM